MINYIINDQILFSIFLIMKNTFDKLESRDGKKFLKTQAYTIAEKIGNALERYDEPDEWWTAWKIEKPINENDYIKNILEERSDLFVRRAIVWDIQSYSRKLWWEERQITQFKCKYGLWITIDNLNSFLDFCAIHGFIPMVDKIYLEWNDISQIKELYNFFAFVITKPTNPLIVNSLANEIKKLEEKFQWPAKEVLLYLQQIVGYTASTYQYLLWDRLQKINNLWTLSENIFAEIAIRIENQIREKVWIESSYLKLAWYKDDMEKKTDMDFIIKKTPNQSYQVIPMQFTTRSTKWERMKEDDIEQFLIKRINSWISQNSFLLFAVNWEFSRHITHWDKEDRVLLNKEYNDWIDNPKERAKNIWSKFPLFIDSIDPKIIQPAEVMYIALHMLYKKYNFRYSTKESYLNSFRHKGKIDRTNRWEINGIKLSEIFIDESDIEEIQNPRPGFPWILKHRFTVSYGGEFVWVIVVYESAR